MVRLVEVCMGPAAASSTVPSCRPRERGYPADGLPSRYTRYRLPHLRHVLVPTIHTFLAHAVPACWRTVLRIRYLKTIFEPSIAALQSRQHLQPAPACNTKKGFFFYVRRYGRGGLGRHTDRDGGAHRHLSLLSVHAAALYAVSLPCKPSRVPCTCTHACRPILL